MSSQDENMTTALSDDDHACPVCLCNPSLELRFFSGDCGHAVCQPCMERILDAETPTVGKCPICRSELKLFELRDGEEKPYPRNTNVQEWPIRGMVYVERQGGVGPSFHFDEDTPYLEFSGEELLDDGTRVPTKKFFDEASHYHDKSRSFHGTVTWVNVSEIDRD